MATKAPRHAVDPSYDPFFDRSRHLVKPRQMRGFPHADTTVWSDRSRDKFSYADIFANTGMRYQLDTGDVVRIDVFEQSNLSRLYRIDGGGFRLHAADWRRTGPRHDHAHAGA